MHSILADTSTASVSAESKCCKYKVISFESITTSTSARLVKSTMSMGPLLFQLQLSTVLHTESENNLCCIDGDITCCFQAPSHSSMSSSSSSATASTWIGSELTAESFADLTRKGKEHMQRIAELLQQNFLRSNRRFADSVVERHEFDDIIYLTSFLKMEKEACSADLEVRTKPTSYLNN